MADILAPPQEGQPVSAGWLLALYNLCRRNRVTVAAGSGLTAREGPDGTALGFIGPDSAVRYIQLSVALLAGNGSTTTGHGKGKLMDHKDGPTATASGMLSVPSGAPDVDVYGLLTPGLKSGSVIAAFKLGDSWHYLMTLCTNGIGS